MPLTAWLSIAAIALPILTFVGTTAYNKIELISAVKAERNEGIRACNARVATIEQTLNDVVASKVKAALEASNAVEKTPEDKAQLSALCNRSASCRDRGKK